MLAISLMKLILVARNAFEAYLIISAVRMSVLDDRRLGLQVAVQAGHALDRLGFGAAQHDAVRVAEVVDGGAFAQELGIADDAEARARAVAGALERGQHPVAGADRHGALVDDDQAALGWRVLAEAVRGGLDLAHVGLALDARRRADADEGELRRVCKPST